jgi:hypothetical protein
MFIKQVLPYVKEMELARYGPMIKVARKTAAGDANFYLQNADIDNLAFDEK